MNIHSPAQSASKVSSHATCKSHATCNRRGATLVEVAIATMMLSVLLVPAIKLVGQSRDLQRTIADENELALHAENLVDQFRIEVKEASVFDQRHRNGFARTSNSESLQMPSVIGRVEAAADTLITTGLMTINVTTWNDENGNRTLDGNEPYFDLRTQVSAP